MALLLRFGPNQVGSKFGQNENRAPKRSVVLSSHDFYPTQVYLRTDLWVWSYLSHTPFEDLTDVTLADEDTNSILTDSGNRAIQGNVTMQVMQPGGQLWNQCKWRRQMTKF